MKRRHPKSAAQCGMSLIEIMIGLALGLLLSAVFMQIYLGSKQTYRLTDALARLQENGRFAMNLLTKDLRMAGFLSCGGGSARVANSVDGDGDWMYETTPLRGYEGGVSTFPTEFSANVRGGTDAVVVRFADPTSSYRVDSHVAESATIHLTQNHDLKQGEILVIANADCTQVGVFQMTNVNNNNTIDVAVHNTGNATSPGNCTKDLQGSFDCSDTSGALPRAYRDGSQLLRFTARAYYVANTDPPALYRRSLSHSGGNATTVAEELVRGVESLQIQYGVDTVKDGQRVADAYLTADQVDAANAGAGAWDDVLSVRIALLLRTLDDQVRPTADANAYDLNGTRADSSDDYDPVDDRRLRKVLTSVVALRNQVP